MITCLPEMPTEMPPNPDGKDMNDKVINDKVAKIKELLKIQ